ncbi:uncharacterized protein [Macrobrachium rosenbergii]|uniref:uncharacterized protein n=1 Tax=Macrobrachium rosenbergii TaxID=79674 RepID=UPI0034D58572
MEDVDIDVELLISLVQERPVLWDKSLEAYKSKTETTAAWREICNHLNPDFESMSDNAKNKFFTHSEVLLADPFEFKSISSRELLDKVTNLETAYVTECSPISSSFTDNRPSGTVNKVRHKVRLRPNSSADSKRRGKSDYGKAQSKCIHCGRDNHLANNCKFKNAKRYSCGKEGHVSTVCSNRKARNKSRNVNTVHDVDESTSKHIPINENFHDSYDLLKLFDVNVNSIDFVDDYEEPYREILRLNGFPLEFELGTGSGASTISRHDANKLNLTPLPTRKRLANYDKAEMQVYGEINCDVSFKGQMVKGQKFFVVDNDLNLAGRSLMKKLKYQWVQIDNVSDDKFKGPLITPSSASRPKLDCVSVSENSQQYLIMNTHLGLYKFHRLPFGLSSAPGIFQRFISELLANIDGVHVFLDDILIAGATKEEHDRSLCKVLSILQQRNVKLNKDKCIIGF